MIEFSFPREHVEIEHPERLPAGSVGHHVELEIVDPFFRCDNLGKFQAEDALIDVEHPIERPLEGKINPQRVGIDGVFFFLEFVLEVAPIPDVDLRVGIFALRDLELAQLRDLGGVIVNDFIDMRKDRHRRIVERTDIGLGGSRTMLVEFGFELRGTHAEVVQAALAAGETSVGTTESYITIEQQTRENAPELFNCPEKPWEDCTE